MLGLLPTAMNNAAMNVSIQISLQDSAFSSFRYILGSGIAHDHVVILCLIWGGGTTWLLSTMTLLFCVPINSAQWF